MNIKRSKLIYRVSTGLLTILMLFTVVMYMTNYDMMSELFVNLGYPIYIIYPLATAKVLGLIAIWTQKSKLLREWAYSGFFFDMTLAVTAHLITNDGGSAPALIGIILLLISYGFGRKVLTSQQVK